MLYCCLRLKSPHFKPHTNSRKSGTLLWCGYRDAEDTDLTIKKHLCPRESQPRHDRRAVKWPSALAGGRRAPWGTWRRMENCSSEKLQVLRGRGCPILKLPESSRSCLEQRRSCALSLAESPCFLLPECVVLLSTQRALERVLIAGRRGRTGTWTCDR